MGFLDDASNLLDRGVSAAKGAVSNVALEQLGFMREFTAMVEDGVDAGFHERNGGNASYRLTEDDVQSARSFFYDNPSSWVPLPEAVPGAAGSFLLVTAAGSYLREMAKAPAIHGGIIEVDPQGGAWRVVWGFKNGGRPTSEIGAHVAAQVARSEATGGLSRVMYHAHPTALAALTALVPADSRELSRILWKSLTESVIAFPEGVGALEWMVPGSEALAKATAEALTTYPAVIWQLHGVFASGATPQEALGLVEAITKAADAYLRAKATVVPGTEPPYQLEDENLRAMASAFDLPINEAFL